MNKSVSASQVSAVTLKLKTALTDEVLYDDIRAKVVLSEAGATAVFNLTKDDLPLIIGNYYKVQIAYVDNTDHIGYYSTIGVAKYTSKPSVFLANCNSQSLNIHTTEYVGVYRNPLDPSERVYEYKFTLTNIDGSIIETSGWKLHNTYSDNSDIESTDSYIVKAVLEPDKSYRMQYSIITNNNLLIEGPKYNIVELDSINANFQASLSTTLDYNNGCVDIKLIGAKDLDGLEIAESGAFVLIRADSATDFLEWTTIVSFDLAHQLPSTFAYRDCTVAHGVTYRYAIQQYNEHKVYSNKIYALGGDVEVMFEDAFLYDGERQLKIRFNPKVSSFKTTYLDTKKTTLGSQFPFIFRNGAVAYKEFSIDGLISYMMDEDELFLSRTEVLGMASNSNDLFMTNILDENLAYERIFKLEVLEWLNNGKVKLFRSPAEGNYLIHLMNTSLTPQDALSRMIHSFKSTANEVAQFNADNLTAYGFIGGKIDGAKAMRWVTTLRADFIERQIHKTKNNVEVAYGKISDVENMNTNILNSYECFQLRIEAMPGTQFDLDGIIITIGDTGVYEISVNEPIKSLHLLNPKRQMPGLVTYGLFSNTTNRFNMIKGVSIYDVLLYSFSGESEDLLKEFNDIKQSVYRINFARFSARKIEILPNKEALFLQIYNYLMDQYNRKLISDNYSSSTENNILSYLNPPKSQNIDPDVLYYLADQKGYVKLNKDEIDLDAASLIQQDYSISAIQKFFDNTNMEKYLQGVDYSTEVQYGDKSFSVENDNDVFIPSDVAVPSKISIGSGVLVEISFSVRVLNYTVEDELEIERESVQEKQMRARAQLLGLVEVTRDQCTEEELAHLLVFDPEYNTFILADEELGEQYEGYVLWLPKNEMMILSQMILEDNNAYTQYLLDKDIYCEKIKDLLIAREDEYLQ